jgi:hypothetical protein
MLFFYLNSLQCKLIVNLVLIKLYQIKNMLRLLKILIVYLGISQMITWIKLYGRRYKNFYNESINLWFKQARSLPKLGL